MNIIDSFKVNRRLHQLARYEIGCYKPNKSPPKHDENTLPFWPAQWTPFSTAAATEKRRKRTGTGCLSTVSIMRSHATPYHTPHPTPCLCSLLAPATHCGPGTVLCMRRGIAVDGGRANARLAAALHQVPAGGPYSKCGTRRPARVAILSFFFNHSHSLLLFLRPRSATKTVYREGKESPPRPICLKGPCVFPDGFCPHQNKCFTCDGPLDCGECGIRARKWKASDNSLTRRQRTFKGWFSFFDRTAAAEEPGKRCPFEGIHCRHPVAFCPHAMRCFSCDDWSCEDCGVTTFPAEAGAEKKPIPFEPV